MKKMKFLAFVLAALVCMTQAAWADSVLQTDTELTLSGAAEAGKDVRLKITDVGGELAWIDSTAASEKGEYGFKASLPVGETAITYKVLLNGAEIYEAKVLSDSDVSALFKAANEETAEELILTYGKRFDFDLEGSYAEDDRAAVNRLFLQEDLSEKSKIQAAFGRSTAINKINNADRSTLLEILENNADVLGIDYDKDINSLSEAQKEALVIAVLEDSYYNFEAFSDAFADSLIIAEDTEEPEDETEPPKKSSSGGGGGGGKISVAVPGASAQTNQTSSETAGENNEQSDEIFTDLKNVAWAKPHIENLYQKGVVKGMEDGSFAPEISVKREEFVAMIVRMFNLTGESDKEFSDIAEGAWYKDAVASAVDAGIINGVTENAFGVGSDITRQDCATICARVLEYFGVSADADAADFADSDEIAEYAQKPVKIMKNLGIINGMDDNCFNPGAACTRAMAAKIIDMLGGCVK